jgi:hypothetical protein
MTEVCKLLKVHRLLTSPYHPQTDGLLEKFHATLSSNLAHYVNDTHNDWDLYLPAICYAYNTTINLDSTGYSPYFLMFGREALAPFDTIIPHYVTDPKHLFLNDFIKKIIKSREVAVANLKQAQTKMKYYYDKKASEVSYEVGDLCWVYVPQITVVRSSTVITLHRSVHSSGADVTS